MTRWIPPVHPPVGFATSILQTPAWNHSAELVWQLETDGFLFPATLVQPPERLPRGLQPGCRVELAGIGEVQLSDRLRLGLAAVLRFDAGIRVVAMAEGGQGAVSLYRKHRLDVVLMDLRMPGLDGVEATRRIRFEFPEARILMLTTYDADEDVRRALDAGAGGYLLKTAGQEELVAALRAVHRGERWLPAGLAARLPEIQEQPSLSARQLEVLELLGKGFSNKEIAGLLGFSEDGAKAHLKTIFAKLGVQDRTEEALKRLNAKMVYAGMEPMELVSCGGASLNLMGWASRSTSVDIICAAKVDAQGKVRLQPEKVLPPQFSDAERLPD